MDFKKLFRSRQKNVEDDVKINFSFSGLRGKILLVVMIPLIFLVIVTGVALTQLGALSNSMNKQLEETLPIISASKSIQFETTRVQNFILMAMFNKTNPDEMNNYMDRTQMAMESMSSLVVDYEKLPLSGNLIKIRSELVSGWSSIVGFIDKAKALMGEKKFSESEALIQDEIKPGLSALIDLTKDIEANNQEAVVKAKEEAKNLSKKAKNYSIFGSLLAFVISLGTSFVFATSISKRFAKIGANLSNNADKMTGTATQIASAAQELSEASTEQAAALQETSSAIEETSSMVRKNSDNSANAAQTSASSLKKAEIGKKVVENMIVSMDHINESNNKIVAQFNDSNQKISEIVELIQVIGKKTKIINEIVFQTKLLSFNASVEAARAGEHGKGFAVVAEEVGSLAQMSGNAAKEITDLLNGSITKVETIVNESKREIESLVAEGKETVRVGTEVAKECGQVLGEIIENVSQVSNLVEEISLASQEQSAGVQEITKAILELGQTTQQNAISSTESANGARDLEEQAEVLRNAILQLNVTIQGSN